MQSDIESSMPTASVQDLDELKQKLLQKSEGDLSHLKSLAANGAIYYGRANGNDSAENSQETLTKKQQTLNFGKKPSSEGWHLLLVLGDVILLLLLLAAVVVLAPSFHWAFSVAIGSFGIKNAWLIGICFALVSWGLAASITQVQNLNYALNRFKSLCSILFTLVLMSIFWAEGSYLLLNIKFTVLTSLVTLFLTLAIPVLGMWRILFAQVMNLPYFYPRAIIVGVNPAGEIVAKDLQGVKYPRVNILGYINEGSEERSLDNDLPILGGRVVLRHLVDNGAIDMIIIALDYDANPALFKDALEAAHYGITVLPMIMFYESIFGKIPVQHAGDQWYAVLQPGHSLSPFYICWKKALDLLFGLCGLLVLCFVLPVIALLIFLDSPGPIFYSQERIGLRGKPFRIYKFRSMRPDAESEGSPIWANASDKRVTRIGRFLRATHLDELPQIFNILRGDMSLIGPRPERAEFISRLEQSIPFYRYRLTVKPGLTGWAQVKYRYGRTDNDALIKLNYDLYYIKRQSLMLDLFVLWMTVFEVLSLRGS